MKKILLAAAAIAMTAPAFAQPAPAPANAPAPGPTIAAAPTAAEAALPRPPRARAIPTTLAVEAALEANANCLSTKYNTTAMITDSVGVPIVMISNENAAAITQRIAMTKVQAVLKYKMSSGEVVTKANADAAFKAEIAANPMIIQARAGAFPIMAGADVVGVFSVSGAPGGQFDEVCVKAGLAKIQGRIK